MPRSWSSARISPAESCATVAHSAWSERMGERVFDGLKVIDCASFIAAPAAATVLADFGAEVIKIEPPGSGDPYRHVPKGPGHPVSPHNYAWLLEGRSKRSLALDLAVEPGRAVLRRLVPGA